ncbi:MAG: hypothetical protein DRG11_06625 [Epsilonproteobacteria bacterium]|nr:MAG: hypothetical protein DRG11_06625 [Campylobacterota bacterium]
MIFGKIDYINLLPFYVFLKKNIKSSQQKAIMNWKKSYPSDINKMFKMRQIDAALISSIKSQKEKCSNVGIISRKDVLSVLCIRGKYKKDEHSSTSNILAKILNTDGQVVIGDKALKLFFQNQNKDDIIDLGLQWFEKYSLPFVYARLCFNKNNKTFNKLSKKFLNTKTKIPMYILNKKAKSIDISISQLNIYLSKISYKIGKNEQKSLKLFFKLSKNYN